MNEKLGMNEMGNDTLNQETGHPSIMDVQESTAMLSIYTPEKIIEELELKEDCTKDIIELIQSTPHSMLGKLKKVFLYLTNFKIEELLELTQSKRRTYRYTSTYLIFSKMRVMSKDFDQIEALYNSVFVIRFRDVDPLIRSMCIDFIVQWILESEALRKLEFLKYVGWALNDRNDVVRRKAIRSFAILATKTFKGRNKIKDEEGRIEIQRFFEKYRNRLLEIAEADSNINLQKDCTKTILSIFIRNSEVFSREQIIDVIGLVDSVDTYKQQALTKLCPEGIWDLEELHNILKISKSFIFKNLKLNYEDMVSFVDNLCEFVSNQSSCCDNSYLCLLEILKEIDLCINPKCYTNLFKIIKDNMKNVIKVIQGLNVIKTFKEYPGETYELIEVLSNYVFESFINKIEEPNVSGEELNSINGEKEKLEVECITEFVKFLKNMNEDYAIQVSKTIEILKNKYPYIVIKCFDISDSIEKVHEPILICYAFLWKMLKNDFQWIKDVEFVDDSQISHYLEVVEFLEFFYAHSDNNETEVLEPWDVKSATKIISSKLYSLIYKNFYFENQESCLHLYKLILKGLFINESYRLFLHCSINQLNFFIENSSSIKHIACGYFEVFLKDPKSIPSGFNLKGLLSLSKSVAGKILKSKRTDISYVFPYIKKLVARKELLDSVLIHFIPILDVNECIVLEGLANKSKFKSLCLRKCKAPISIKAEENITFI